MTHRINIDLKYGFFKVRNERGKVIEKNGVKDEDSLKKGTVAAIHALLNSETGGEVKLSFTGSDALRQIDQLSTTLETSVLERRQVKNSFIRKIEQILEKTAGTLVTLLNVNIKESNDKDALLVEVKSANVLVVSATNLYLPTVSQVIIVCAADSAHQVIHEIVNRKHIEQEITLKSHRKGFVRYTSCGFQESKCDQFKFLDQTDQAIRTKLAVRMTSKGNKFSSYVSAFANYQGGHIYFGINDDGIVQGESVSSEAEKIEITKSVEKTINKMIWPEQIGQPKQRVHWEIIFEPVLDKYSKPIPSTFVIVVYIAACLGGVFTENPECFELVEGEVKKMPFEIWKRRMLFHSDKILSTLQRVTRIKSHCVMVNELLTQCMNKGESIADLAKHVAEVQCPELIEVQLVILSKLVMECYRRNYVHKASKLLDKYDGLLNKVKKGSVFDDLYAIRAYLEVALHQARGHVDALRHTLLDALNKAGKIEPGIITAGICLLTATVLIFHPSLKEDLVGRDEGCSPDVLSNRALQHLQNVTDSPFVRADLEQKAHITLALFHLEYNASKHVLTNKHVDAVGIGEARSCLAEASTSVREGNPINLYREVQFNVVLSIVKFRQSQIQSDEKESVLKEALECSKKAANVALQHQFDEMSLWAKDCVALCTEGLMVHAVGSRRSSSSSQNN